MAAWVAIGRQNHRIALTGHNRTDDGHAGDAGDVCYHVVELQIHLRQRFLHVLDVRGSLIQQTFTLA